MRARLNHFFLWISHISWGQFIGLSLLIILISGAIGALVSGLIAATTGTASLTEGMGIGLFLAMGPALGLVLGLFLVKVLMDSAAQTQLDLDEHSRNVVQAELNQQEASETT